MTLAPALASKVQAGDTLFVFARASDGPRMPLAMLHKQVKDLPLEFVLDDRMAMTPEMRLSSATRGLFGAGGARPRGLKVEIAEVVVA